MKTTTIEEPIPSTLDEYERNVRGWKLKALEGLCARLRKEGATDNTAVRVLREGTSGNLRLSITIKQPNK